MRVRVIASATNKIGKVTGCIKRDGDKEMIQEMEMNHQKLDDGPSGGQATNAW